MGAVAADLAELAVVTSDNPRGEDPLTIIAEVLSGITLAQLTARGTPVIYGSSTTAMDLRLASASVGSPECGLIGAAVAQMARRYLLPSWVAGA